MDASCPANTVREPHNGQCQPPGLYCAPDYLRLVTSLDQCIPKCEPGMHIAAPGAAFCVADPTPLPALDNVGLLLTIVAVAGVAWWRSL